MNMRIGLLGGSFDPIHNAHLALATAATQALNLDRLQFIVAGDPWQKRDRVVTPAQDRLAMVQKAIAESSEARCWQADDSEIKRAGQTQGPTYTVNTLKAIRASEPNAQLFWIIGSDAFVKLDTWREWERLFDYTHFAVALRGDDVSWQDRMSTALRTQFLSRRLTNQQAVQTSGAVVEIAMPPSNISSTQIRALANSKDFEALKTLAPTGVLEYITNHNLYA